MTFAPGPRKAANIAGFQRSMAGFCQTVQQSTCVLTSQRPNGVTNYASIDRTPAVLAALLAAIGAAVLGQFIVVCGSTGAATSPSSKPWGCSGGRSAR